MARLRATYSWRKEKGKPQLGMKTQNRRREKIKGWSKGLWAHLLSKNTSKLQLHVE